MSTPATNNVHSSNQRCPLLQPTVSTATTNYVLSNNQRCPLQQPIKPRMISLTKRLNTTGHILRPMWCYCIHQVRNRLQDGHLEIFTHHVFRYLQGI